MEREGEAVNFGRSIIVPSVQELAKESFTNIPSRYVRDHLDDPIDHSLLSIPVVDLEKLIHGESMEAELHNLHFACKEWGFFQLINHGVSSSMLETFKEEVIEFFQLPMEEKKKLWQQPGNIEGFGQAFVFSHEQKLDWCDMSNMTTLPHTLRRATLEAYIVAMRDLAQTLLNYMARALEVDEMEMKELFSEGMQSMRMNYYPPCPEPNKVIGLAPHSDATAITILLQLNETQGLQIRKIGNWIPVIPFKNAFVVNIGDVMEIVSNGIYRSIEHKAMVNSTMERISVATFYFPNLDSEIGPSKSITGALCPPVFRKELMKQYLKKFYAKELDGKSHLEAMKIHQQEFNTT